ncbi:MAG: CRISPR-associated helicase Cas3' [Fimbriimonadales bacterium]
MYAHTPNSQGKWHDLRAHLESVAAQAERFAQKFNAGSLGYYLGLWHDLGKVNPQFQQYLQACHRAEQQGAKPPASPVPHAIHGALYAVQVHLQPLAFPLIGHHAGMPDVVDLQQALQHASQAHHGVIGQALQWLPELEPAQDLSQLFPEPIRKDACASAFFTRLLFSCLVDADYLDTEAHFEPNRASLRGKTPSLQDLWNHFEQDQQALLSRAPDTPVNRIRREVYHHCVQSASGQQGFYRLTVPTGGGKTRSALAFALLHALHHGLDRVIVAIPYTSIIDQTAEVYRQILGDSAVLEHHSALDPERWDEDMLNRQRLLSENWNAPLIVTTTVQLFESLFSNRPTRCRKLHNIVRSVIVLDEVQTLPVQLLKPTLYALQELVSHYGCTVVFCTATQPAFNKLGLPPSQEIVPDPASLYQQLKRVEYRRIPEPLTHAEVAQRMQEHRQCLVVVNTRRDALEVLQNLPEADSFHLSTLLCPYDRRRILREVKHRLDADEPCWLVSTQVVEAGVDIDFPVAMRVVGPLDRVVQVAGRCNREGRRDRGQVYLFELANAGMPRGVYRTETDVATRILKEPDCDLHNPETYTHYFEQLYPNTETDAKKIQEHLCRWNYRSVADDYRLISEDTVPVVVFPDGGEAEAIVETIQQIGKPTRSHWHRLQVYTVSLYRRDFENARKQGLIEELMGLYLWRGAYDSRQGISLKYPDPADLIVV